MATRDGVGFVSTWLTGSVIVSTSTLTESMTTGGTFSVIIVCAAVEIGFSGNAPNPLVTIIVLVITVAATPLSASTTEKLLLRVVDASVLRPVCERGRIRTERVSLRVDFRPIRYRITYDSRIKNGTASPTCIDFPSRKSTSSNLKRASFGKSQA